MTEVSPQSTPVRVKNKNSSRNWIRKLSHDRARRRARAQVRNDALPAAIRGPGDQPATDLADAPGRPVPARVSCDARHRRLVPRPVLYAPAGMRGDAAADPSALASMRRSCSPTSSSCRTPWASRCASSRARVQDSNPLKSSGRLREAIDYRRGCEIRYRRRERGADPVPPGEQYGPDRVLRGAVDSGDLHGRWARLARPGRNPPHGLSRARFVLPADRSAGRGLAGLSRVADRSRRRLR